MGNGCPVQDFRPVYDRLSRYTFRHSGFHIPPGHGSRICGTVFAVLQFHRACVVLFPIGCHGLCPLTFWIISHWAPNVKKNFPVVRPLMLKGQLCTSRRNGCQIVGSVAAVSWLLRCDISKVLRGCPLDWGYCSTLVHQCQHFFSNFFQKGCKPLKHKGLTGIDCWSAQGIYII